MLPSLLTTTTTEVKEGAMRDGKQGQISPRDGDVVFGSGCAVATWCAARVVVDLGQPSYQSVAGEVEIL